nr:hypothetical protein CFP56_73161 [Quercus suber]
MALPDVACFHSTVAGVQPQIAIPTLPSGTRLRFELADFATTTKPDRHPQTAHCSIDLLKDGSSRSLSSTCLSTILQELIVERLRRLARSSGHEVVELPALPLPSVDRNAWNIYAISWDENLGYVCTPPTYNLDYRSHKLLCGSAPALNIPFTLNNPISDGDVVERYDPCPSRASFTSTYYSASATDSLPPGFVRAGFRDKMAMASPNLDSEDGIHRDTAVSQPTIKIISSSHDYCGPYPDFIDGSVGDRVSGKGCAPVIKISPNLVVKYGSHVKVTEAESLLFLEKNAPNIPVPRVQACYLRGPYNNRDPDDFGSLYDTYIVMTFMEGQCLDVVWNDLDQGCRTSIAAQLHAHMQELRSISREDELTVASVTGGPIKDPILKYHSSQGPFATEEDFNAALVAVHEELMYKAHCRSLVEGALAQNKHKIVLTHGDLQGRNIMVAGGKLVGIIDWETCGWYPEYWEFAKCFAVSGWPKDWPDFVSQVLEPYYCQWVLYDMIKRYVL